MATKLSVYNGRLIESEDCTPTWEAILPALLAVLQDGNSEGKRLAKEQLKNMAQVADMYVEKAKDLGQLDAPEDEYLPGIDKTVTIDEVTLNLELVTANFIFYSYQDELAMYRRNPHMEYMSGGAFAENALLEEIEANEGIEWASNNCKYSILCQREQDKG